MDTSQLKMAAWGLTFPPPSGQLSHTVAGLEGARLQAFRLGDDHAGRRRVPTDGTGSLLSRPLRSVRESFQLTQLKPSGRLVKRRGDELGLLSSPARYALGAGAHCAGRSASQW